MAKKFLITGGAGFVASHLTEYLIKKGEVVFSTIRWNEDLSRLNPDVKTFPMDLTDLSACIRCVQETNPDYIIHLAAQSFVNDSFINPLATLKANVEGTVNLFEAVRLTEIDPVIYVASCYDSDTEILTKRGFLHYQDIRQDDLVVSIDPNTKIIDYRPIKRIIVDDYSGAMARIKTRSIDVCVTPNHTMLFTHTRNGKAQFRKISEITAPTTYHYLLNGRFQGKDKSTIEIGGQLYDTHDIFYLMGLYIGDGYSDQQTKIIANKTGLNRSEYLKLARNDKGQFISGKRGDEITSLCHSYRVFLAIPKGDKARLRAIDCLTRLGIKYHLYDNVIFFSSKEFFKFFNEIGHSALIKSIPEWVFDFDAIYLESLYKGLIDSDGSYRKGREISHSFCTSSIKLADDFTKLCLFIGKTATQGIRCVKDKFPRIGGRVIPSRPNYTFSITRTPKIFRGVNIRYENYSGKVWCVEVEGTHNVVVRRNGKSLFCGNSSEVYGDVTKDEIPIGEMHPFRPANPYAASKVAVDAYSYTYWRYFGLKIIRTRWFTHCGKGRTMLSFENNFARQIALIEAGRQPPIIKVGNLASIRTIADVRDAVKGIYLTVKKCQPGEVYNIGGSTTKSVGEVLEYLCSLSPRKDDIQVEIDPSLLRKADVSLQIPSCEKFIKATHWKPEIPIEKTLLDILSFWRAKVG